MTEFVVILVEPQIQGNIGAVARTMMNFGVKKLRIVGEIEITEEARKRAVHAQIVLNQAKFFPSVKKALEDLTHTTATTGITPGNKKRHLRSHLELPDFSKKVIGQDGQIGLVFGRENYGLLNSELKLCDTVVGIPTSREYPIMNLSHAVSTTLYQLYIDKRKENTGGRARKRSDPDDLNRLFDRIDRVLRDINYPEHKRENTLVMIRRILGRAFLSAWEFHTLMGVIRKVERGIRIGRENRSNGKSD